jgi:hypothetical protein
LLVKEDRKGRWLALLLAEVAEGSWWLAVQQAFGPDARLTVIYLAMAERGREETGRYLLTVSIKRKYTVVLAVQVL